MYVRKRTKRRTAGNLKIYDDRMRTQRISVQNPKYSLRSHPDDILELEQRDPTRERGFKYPGGFKVVLNQLSRDI